MTDRTAGWRRWGYAVWIALIAGFAVLHALNLRADFPNGSPWVFDWAKYTDEGWYGDAAVRAHLFGNWYMAGDFNPAVALPVWQFAEWVLFFFTGVSIAAARGLAIACFFASLALSYLLLRARGPRSNSADEDLSAGTPVWMALLALTLVVTSPFLYCFSRLAILEPLQTTLLLASLNLAVRLPRMKRPAAGSAWIGFLFALMMLTKTTSLFLAPAVGWAMVVPLRQRSRLAIKCALAAAVTAAAMYGVWMVLIASRGLMADYKYFFFVNKYEKPREFYWSLLSFWWSLHGLWWVDHSLIWLACAVVVGAAVAWRSGWGRWLWREPLFGVSLWVVAGFVLFMTLQNHPQPRYFAAPALFCFYIVALGVNALVREAGWARILGYGAIVAAGAAVCVHGARTVHYATHPETTWVDAAAQLTHYIDTHANGKRMLVSISGDEITLLTHLPSLCDDFGTEPLPVKLEHYQPGWFATWNEMDPSTLEDLHEQYSVEQVAAFAALDDPYRNLLVLFKLHPLPAGQLRGRDEENLRDELPGDEIDIGIE